MKKKILCVRLVGAEDATIIEKNEVPIEAVIGLIQCITPDENYLEVSIKEIDIQPNVGVNM